MLPGWTVQLGTLLSVGVGFVLGWIWRGWRDRALVVEELRKRGIDPEDL